MLAKNLNKTARYDKNLIPTERQRLVAQSKSEKWIPSRKEKSWWEKANASPGTMHQVLPPKHPSTKDNK